MCKYGTGDNISKLKFTTLAKLSFKYSYLLFMKKHLASATNFLLLRVILACKLLGMLAKMSATDLYVLTFSFLC